MAYSELIKSFERIRDYIRDFYICGFRTREQYTNKSARSYDNERRRIESYLDGYIGSHRTREGKNIFVSIDSRAAGSNPLYRVLKAKSFTDGDITLHFILFDILHSPQIALSLSEISKRADGILSEFPNPMCFEESTVRKKLAEYAELGLIKTERCGRQTLYSRTESVKLESWRGALEFFSEVAVCGAAGNFLLDKLGGASEYFTFKHHYITHVLDSEVLCELLVAISEKRAVAFTYKRSHGAQSQEIYCVPLKILISVQTGRRWLAGDTRLAGDSRLAAQSSKRISLFRLDGIHNVTLKNVCPQFSALREKFENMQQYIWGASLGGRQKELVSFTLKLAPNEDYMLTKLEREKRCGKVEVLSQTENETTVHFSAQVYDSCELIPWIRSFTGFISETSFSNKMVEKTLRDDLEEMYKMYGIKET